MGRNRQSDSVYVLQLRVEEREQKANEDDDIRRTKKDGHKCGPTHTHTHTHTHTRNQLQTNVYPYTHTHTTMMMNRQRRSNMVLVNTNYSVQLINMHEDKIKAPHTYRSKANSHIRRKSCILQCCRLGALLKPPLTHIRGYHI